MLSINYRLTVKEHGKKEKEQADSYKHHHYIIMYFNNTSMQ